MTITAATPNTILLATDLSARCDRALSRALQLARQWQARLVVATVLPDMAATSISGNLLPALPSLEDEQARQLAERRLQRLLDGEAEGLTVDVRIGHGHVGRALLQLAMEEDCGLIVTGIARDPLFELPLLGSPVSWLIRHSTLPVLIVHERVRGPYRNLAVASDFSDGALQSARDALALFGPPLQLALIHALDVPGTLLPGGNRETLEEQAMACAREQGQASLALLRGQLGQAHVQALIAPGEPARVVSEQALMANSELVVVATHGRGALYDLLIGSIARRLVETLEIDTLLVRDPRARSSDDEDGELAG